MKTIHKHRLELLTEVQEIRLPEAGKVLRVDYVQQERLVYMWVEVDADTVIDTPREVRRFKVFSTGTGIPDNAHYIGTTLDQLKPEAYHVYELVD